MLVRRMASPMSSFVDDEWWYVPAAIDRIGKAPKKYRLYCPPPVIMLAMMQQCKLRECS